MADRGIIFSTPMVRALLDGRKTQTRRLITPRPFVDAMGNFCAPDRKGRVWNWGQNIDGTPCLRNFIKKMPYAPGDRLYVREAWTARMTHGWTIADARSRMFQEEILYRADGVDSIDGWWPSIHMPREFSRLWLAVTDVRVQRLQDINEADIKAEGVKVPEPRMMMMFGMDASERRDYRLRLAQCEWSNLWDSLHTKPGERWEDNPWIVAVTFDVNRGNIDTTPAASDAATPRASAPHALSPEAGQRTPLSDDEMGAAIQ